MVENKKAQRNILNLIIGLAFFGYGSFRLYSYLTGEEYSNLRIVIFIGFLVLGIIDIYKYFRPW